MIEKLILKNRTYRRFHQEHKISNDQLLKFINLARLSGSSANLQPLKYLISNDSHTNELIFSNIAWAGYLKDWPGPAEGEKPSSYIVILGDTTISKNFAVDTGIAAQSILLGAVEEGLGGCMFGSIKREELKWALKLEDHLDILLVIALGIPKENVVVEDLQNNDIKYWRDENQIHHVPKRKLSEIVITLEDK